MPCWGKTELDHSPVGKCEVSLEESGEPHCHTEQEEADPRRANEELLHFFVGASSGFT